jgi:phosphatidylglycerophosphate synthase
MERNSGVRGNGKAFTLLENLADLLTFSRLVIGLIILYFSVIGPQAYIVVVVLGLMGAATDILDGRAARRYLSGREGRLGKYDIFIDVVFIFCILAYLSFSGIIPVVFGLGWITLATVVVMLYPNKQRILTIIEIPSVMAILAAVGFYDPGFFVVVVVPIFVLGLIFNRKRLIYLFTEKWPQMFLGK